MTAIVGLLRGVNLAGRARVPMAELRDVATALDLDGVRTYLQSGNLLFEAPAERADEVRSDLERAVAKTFGLEIPILVRTRDELAATVAGNPYAGVEDDPTRVHAVFLADHPADERVAELETERFRPDTFWVSERVVYVHYPGGAGRSKLTIDYFERRLATTATARNWNTVTKLLALMNG